MKAIVLGSAAGGGYPQWNCRCAICTLWWNGDPRVERRTQSSVAATADGQNWLLLNCSPDVREQIGAIKALQPKSLRHSPIVAVILTNADIDHVAGLLSLREMQALTVWASPEVLEEVRSNRVFSVLNPSKVVFSSFGANEPFFPLPGLVARAFQVQGKAPLYREEERGHAIGRSGDTVGLHLDQGGRRLTYIPGCADVDTALINELSSTDTLLFDGTLFCDDEMITSGTGSKTARRMGHVPVSGSDGTLARLAIKTSTKRYFVHMNNTNPLLVEGSPERQLAEEAGWTISHDGLELTL